MDNKCISSGIKAYSAVILEQEGWLKGAVLTAGGTTAKVTFYDSADSELGGKKEVGFIGYYMTSFDFTVHCNEGIYAVVEADAEYMVLYDV